MPKRVAVLLIGKLSEALKTRCIDVADSEPYWLRPDQYNERDGGVEFLPAKAPEMMAYCRTKQMRPLGLVTLADNGHYADYVDSEFLDNSMAKEDRQFATHLFQAHAHFWFCVLPWLESQTSKA